MKFANAAVLTAGILFAVPAMAADYTIRLASSLSPGEPHHRGCAVLCR